MQTFWMCAPVHMFDFEYFSCIAEVKLFDRIWNPKKEKIISLRISFRASNTIIVNIFFLRTVKYFHRFCDTCCCMHRADWVLHATIIIIYITTWFPSNDFCRVLHEFDFEVALHFPAVDNFLRKFHCHLSAHRLIWLITTYNSFLWYVINRLIWTRLKLYSMTSPLQTSADYSAPTLLTFCSGMSILVMMQDRK